MSTKISDLAEKLDLSAKDLKNKIAELGFELSPRARVVDDEVAELLIDELKSAGSKEGTERNENEGNAEEELDKKPEDIADIYDEMISEEREREIVKSQRKQTAGRADSRDKKGKVEASAAAVTGQIEIPDPIAVKE